MTNRLALPIKRDAPTDNADRKSAGRMGDKCDEGTYASRVQTSPVELSEGNGMDASFVEAFQHAVNEFLMWVGFGTIVGLTAKAIMPGRDPGGAIATMLMGIVGCVIGCGTVMFFTHETAIKPITPIGFCAATGGAFVLLLFYRIFAGSFFLEAEAGDKWAHNTRRRRRRDGMAKDL
ncbi:MAG: hypothetical protein R3B91_10700 [Planctomycetaceae bacterium]